ncbi:putative protein isoform X2 [Gossypium australe]|uniref:Uncharacterized protein n=1 Tax=Gossypium australe TaxID=47621 RepID=A0A5B6WNT0_9ROSI|nr:putative protein isoform X2 [Gossypium australe]
MKHCPNWQLTNCNLPNSRSKIFVPLLELGNQLKYLPTGFLRIQGISRIHEKSTEQDAVEILMYERLRFAYGLLEFLLGEICFAERTKQAFTMIICILLTMV